MTTAAATSPGSAGPSVVMLPRAVSVLAVTARPGQESELLGGLVYAFRRAGATLSLLCLTRGEAARSDASARLEAIRPWELQLAAAVLGISDVAVGNFRDGKLHHYAAADLTGRIRRAIRRQSPDLVVVIAPEAGDKGDAAVARAAIAAAARAGHLDGRPGRRHADRPRDPAGRRRRAHQPVGVTAQADAPPGPPGRAGGPALAAVPPAGAGAARQEPVAARGRGGRRPVIHPWTRRPPPL
jgi:LmbE family N-acetylglucosaminyl deacetylase